MPGLEVLCRDVSETWVDDELNQPDKDEQAKIEEYSRVIGVLKNQVSHRVVNVVSLRLKYVPNVADD